MKELEVLFGVKTTDMEKAKKWIETATGKLAGAPFHNDYVGDYYRFGDFGPDEDMELCSGVSEDEDGKYPTEHEFPSWPLVLRLSKAKENSPFLKGLEARPDWFEKLKTDEF